MANQRVHDAWLQIDSARNYTLGLIKDVSEDEWFAIPTGLATHVAWQVGHLAMAEYGLALFRRRGRQDIDRELMPASFRKDFAKGTDPLTVPRSYSPSDILEVLRAIHDQVERELAECCDDDLTAEVDMPYAGEPTKLGALWFCAHHEMLHAGQIGLLRRALGKPPLR